MDWQPMKPIFTNRGFVRYEFDDRYGEPCSLQESMWRLVRTPHQGELVIDL